MAKCLYFYKKLHKVITQRHCSFLSKLCSAVNVIYWATCFFATSAKGSTLIGFVFNNMFLRFLQRRLYVSSTTCSSPLVSSFFFFLIFSFVDKGKHLLGVPSFTIVAHVLGIVAHEIMNHNWDGVCFRIYP